MRFDGSTLANPRKVRSRFPANGHFLAGLFRGAGSAALTTGAWLQGDVIENSVRSAAGGNAADLHHGGVVFGTWKPRFGTIAAPKRAQTPREAGPSLPGQCNVENGSEDRYHLRSPLRVFRRSHLVG